MKRHQQKLSVVMTLVMLLSVWLPFMPMPQASAQTDQSTEIESADTEDRMVRFTYVREDATFGDWNIWAWNTGVKDDQIDFDTYEGTKAVANIAVGPTTKQFGFVLRSTYDWDTAEKEFGDRFIPVNTNDSLTKAIVTSGVEQIFIVPDGSAPIIQQGDATFYYRDKALFANDAMHAIEKVELKFNGETMEMTYEPENERFVAAYENVPNGQTPYSYLVTINGETTEVTDPYNTTNGESIIDFRQLDLTVTGTVSPQAFHANQHAVLNVNLDGLTDDATIATLTADITSLGGSSQLSIDPSLKKITLSVTDDVAPGIKTIPLTATDSYGNTYAGTAEVEVVAKPQTEEEFDWDEAIIYFMLTDRFFDGDATNNDPYNLGYDTSKRGTYQGGDLKGITEKLDYLDDLGVNTIWISPIVENVKYDVRMNEAGEPYYAYHGYWANDFGELNPHFGTMEDFHTLIDAAHDRDMKIMVDVVLNHTGYGLKEIDTMEEPPAGYPTDADRARFADLVRQGANVGTDEVLGELAGLPDLRTEDPAVRQQIIDWQTAWIDKATTDKGNTIDYFRVDTVKHVEDTTWMAFKTALTEKKSDFKLIGEAWGAHENNQLGYLGTGMMDSLLDFEFKNTARSFVNGQLKAANDKLTARNDKLTSAATLGQFLGSHDEDGFLHSLGGDTGKLKVAASLQATSKGQPVIYYGEELGQTGANNYPQYDNRYDFTWDQVEGNDVLDHYTKVLNFRGDHSKAFAKGDRTTIGGTDKDQFMLVQRSYEESSVYVGFHVGTQAKDITLTLDTSGAVVTDSYSGKSYTADAEGKLALSLPAMADGGTVLLTVDAGTIVSATAGSESGSEVTPVPDNHLRIHYKRDDNNYTNYGAWLWNDVKSPSANWPVGATMFENTDDYGAYIDVELAPGAKNVGFLVMDITKGDAGKDGGDKGFTIVDPAMNEIWIKQGSDTVYTYEPVDLPENTVRIHYTRTNGDYENFGVWNWGDVANPSANWPTDAIDFAGVDRYGAYADIQLNPEAKEMGFLIINEQTQEKDGGDKSFNLLDKYNRLWIQQGDDTVYISPYQDVATGLVSAEVIGEETISLGFTMTDGLDAEKLKSELQIRDNTDTALVIDSVTIVDSKKVEVKANFALDAVPLSITYAGRTVSATTGWRLIDEMYAYDGELGAIYEDGDATLKLWAPKATQVVANFFDKDDAATNIGSVELTLNEQGVWSKKVTADELDVADLNGYYYQYEVTHDGVTKTVLDPYAKSMAAFTVNTEGQPGPDGDLVGKAAIIDLAGTDPAGFDHAKIDDYEKREDAIIYELHVRDFTSDPSISDELTNRFGTYASFVEKLDYIKSLGVTHVQLLPVMAWYFGDETNMTERELEYSAGGNEYNWGYDPHGYFSPDGAYSQDATDPELRVKELKALIDTIHDSGMGVVLDVVYTHMAKASHLNDIVPDYYFYQDANGNFLGGFGNNLATNHKMAEKLMIDSVKYWFDEYKIDGMRFDMMGDATYPSIQNAYDAAAAINPHALFIGEGWRTFAGHVAEPDLAGMGADQDWMNKTDDVGVFSDEIRNELKSGFGSEGEPRFITGGARSIQTIFNNIKGQPSNTAHDDPGDMVQYIEAHDNLPLYDVIAQSIKKDPSIAENDVEIHQRIRVGNAMILTSQGTAFLHAGQEFGRTKQWFGEGVPEQKYHELKDENGKTFGYFIHDSYDSSDAINKFDWQKAEDAEMYPVNHVTGEYTKGLIELRKSTNAFRLGSKDLVDANVTLLDIPEVKENDLAIAYKAQSTDNTGTYYVFVNADDKSRTFTVTDLNLTRGQVIVDNDEAGTKKVKDASGFTLTQDQLTLDGLTTVIIKVSGNQVVNPAPNPAPPVVVPGGPQDIQLPSGAVEVVRTVHANGTMDVMTRVLASQVDAIVSGISETKTVIRLKLENAQPRERVMAALPARLVTEALKKNQRVVVTVEATDGVYHFPLSEVDVAALAAELGVGLRDFELIISVNPVDNPLPTLSAASKAVEFKVEAVSGTKRVDVTDFSHYVTREIVLTKIVNPSKAVAVRVEEDGSFTAVPTTFDGNVAQIHSLTNSVYLVVEQSKTFRDIGTGHWAKAYIETLGSKYIVNGKLDGTYGPSEDMTRAEFTVLLVRALGLPSKSYDGRFLDVTGNEWFNKNDELMAAIQYGIIQGKTDGTFAPNEKLTRAQAAVMIARALDHEMLDVDPTLYDSSKRVSQFKDHEAMSSWSKPSIEKVYQAGIMSGMANGHFDPHSYTKRDQMAKILAEFLKVAGLM